MIFFFFFNDTATTEIYTLSLHDALPISFISTRRLGGHRRLRNLHGWANEKRIGMGSGCVDLDGCRMHCRSEFSPPATSRPATMDDAGRARRVSRRRDADRFMVEIF